MEDGQAWFRSAAAPMGRGAQFRLDTTIPPPGARIPACQRRWPVFTCWLVWYSCFIVLLLSWLISSEQAGPLLNHLPGVHDEKELAGWEDLGPALSSRAFGLLFLRSTAVPTGFSSHDSPVRASRRRRTGPLTFGEPDGLALRGFQGPTMSGANERA